jgi:hypothetical protein
MTRKADNVRTVQVERATLPTWGGRALHVTIERNAAGEPERLELSEGYVDGGRDFHRAVQVPGHVLAELYALLGTFLEVEP